MQISESSVTGEDEENSASEEERDDDENEDEIEDDSPMTVRRASSVERSGSSSSSRDSIQLNFNRLFMDTRIIAYNGHLITATFGTIVFFEILLWPYVEF